jgi:D-glycero-D-manno-heptose 1,7-bisphosphate phosphatase
MIESAMADFEIDVERSWIVGDKKSDVELGKNAGLQSALVLTGYGQIHQKMLEHTPDIITSDFGNAARIIIDRSQ